MALPTASDNAFPSILITEGTEPAAPAAGKQRLYIDSTSHKLKVTNSSGTDSVIGPGGAAAIASDTIWDAKGDLVAGTGADAAAKLTVGTNGYLLVADSAQSTGLKWDPRFHGCFAYNDGTQSINNNSSTAITMGAESFDTDAYHSTSSNTSRITIPTGLGGVYLIGYHASWAANATGVRIAFLRLNDPGNDTTNLIGSRTNLTPISGTLSSSISSSVIVTLAAADYVELFMYQNSGGSLNAGSSLAVDRGDVSAIWCQLLG